MSGYPTPAAKDIIALPIFGIAWPVSIVTDDDGCYVDLVKIGGEWHGVVDTFTPEYGEKFAEALRALIAREAAADAEDRAAVMAENRRVFA